MRVMSDKDIPRLVLAGLVLSMLGFVLWFHHDDPLIIGAVIALATTAVNYFLGSSKGSADKSAELARRDEPSPVQVVNPPDQPVPTAEAAAAPDERPDYAR